MGISQYSMYDVSGYLSGTYSTTSALKAENSTSRENNTDLNMTDFLQLMIVQLQSQTLDSSMDTSDMLNQMVQMQMVTALTNMTETNIMTYASSMVGKEVTIGIMNGTELEERVVDVIGTGTSNGQQVIFGKDQKTGKVETYNLSQIMAIGKLPPKEAKPDDSTSGTTTPTTPPATTPPAGTTDPDNAGNAGDSSTDDVQDPGSATDKPVETPDDTQDSTGTTDNANYDGSQGAPADEV